jgi:hypothetical protein
LYLEAWCELAAHPLIHTTTLGGKRDRLPCGSLSKRFAESVAVSSTTPVDFPISALADFLVQPLGAASTYFRAALGALVNLRREQLTYKASDDEKLAFCGFSIINISTAHRASCG